MTDPDNFTYKAQKQSLYAIRQFVLPDIKNALQAVCITISDENKRRYENGLKPISPYYYGLLMFREAMSQIYAEKDNGKLAKVTRAKQMGVNRGTMREWEQAARGLHDGQV